MKNIIFVTISKIIEINQEQIKEHGGIHGIRDMNLLDSAINMPEMMFANTYFHKDLYEMAAAYAYHIIKNHPFLDGNKRTGALAALIFLEINNININFEKNALYNLSMKIASSKITKKEIAQIFKEKTLHN